MSFYVMSDIHGCFDEFIKMLDKIEYTSNDCLILAGDNIDRGDQSFEMVNWLMEHKSPKTVLLRGNHEEEFIEYVNILNTIQDNISLYDICEQLYLNTGFFDLYGTIRYLIKEYNFTIDDLNKWADFFSKMPLLFKKKVGTKRFIVAHAGYICSIKGLKYSSNKEFYLYAREDNFLHGGYEGATIITGHTPTIIESEFSYNNGDVFKYYNKDKNCTFYDIDCGCVFRDKYQNAKLSCLCLDTEQIYYI